MNLSNSYVKKLVQLVLELQEEQKKPENYGPRAKMISMIDYLSGYVEVLREPSETTGYCVEANQRRTRITEEVFGKLKKELLTKTRKEVEADNNLGRSTVGYVDNSPTYQDYKRFIDLSRVKKVSVT